MTSKIVVNNIESDAGVSTVFFNSDIGGTGGTLNVDGNLNVDGVLSYEDVTNIDSVGLITARAGVKVPDSQRIFVGTDDDLEIYHDGNTRVRHTGAGDLLLQSNSDVYIQRASDGHQMIIAENDGPVKLYYDNSEKFKTTSGGVEVSSGNLTMQSNGRIFVGNGGNATNPMFANVSDTNTGIAFPAADTMMFTTGGSERLRIDDAGRLLIGRTTALASSAERLTIDSGMAMFRRSSTNAAAVYIRNEDTTADTRQPYLIFTDGGGNRGGFGVQYNESSLWISGQGGIAFRTGGSAPSQEERLRITSDGKVGIGTDDPGNHKLHLYGETNSDLRLTATGDDIINMFVNTNRSSANASLFAIKGEWNGTQVANMKFLVGDDTTNKDDGYITFATRESGTGSSTERLRISSAGLVGIGINNPTSDLHVFRSTSASSIIDAAAGDALLTLRNAGNGNWSGINFTRERSTGTNVVGGSIWMPSDTSNNSSLLYIQTQTASGNAGVDSALTNNNGVRLKLASQPGGAGADSAFTVEVGSTEKFRISAEGYVTKSNHPCFDAVRNSGHMSAQTYINYNTVKANNGGHYNSSNGRFTAPVAGYYFFSWTSIKNNTNAVTRLYIHKNGSATYGNRHLRLDSGQDYGDNGTMTAVIQLAVNDYVQIYLEAGSIYGATEEYCIFNGYLLG